MKLLYHITLISIIAITFLTSCVERYHPDELYLRPGILVISAHITDNPGIQFIEISRSSHIESPGFQAELDCYIELIREDGESHNFSSSDRPGFYAADLDTAFLRPGMLFQLQVVTGDGEEYHSDFDKIRPVPAIDSVYYEVESMKYWGEDDPVPGIRFFADFTYDDEAYEYIRWELKETYEFHNPDMAAYIYVNWRTVRLMEEEENPKVCYFTHELPAVHSLSTKEIDFGSFSKPFDFVPNDQMEQKLHHKYSLLIRQYSLGPEGYQYWHELGANNQEQGQIFNKQPALLNSNICNIADENEKVLGFFTMSAMQETRAFAQEIPGFDTSPLPGYCLPIDRGPGSNRPTNFPSYFARASFEGTSVFAEVNKHCVDCREYKKSTEVKPDFW